MDRPLRIDEQRLLRNLAELAKLGCTNSGGRTRLAFSSEDGLGRRLLISLMRDAGLDVAVDGIGNIFGTLSGSDKNARPIMVGSHIDTVVNAGHLDGCLGVLAGLEAILAIRENGTPPRHPIVVAAFSNEEGVRFSPDLMGSRVFTGELALGDALAATDLHGQTVGEALARMEESQPIGTIPSLPQAYVELHIEQGPVLWASNTQLGIVEGVQGCRWLEVKVRGSANHAGTTPMDARRDAGVAVAHLVGDLTKRSREQKIPSVATVGTMSIVGGSINSIPEYAIFTVDFRDPDDRILDSADNQLRFASAKMQTEYGVAIDAQTISETRPVQFDAELITKAAEIAGSKNISYRRMFSGASHDAQIFSAHCPAIMLFCPSKNGVSHNPNEHTDDECIVRSAQILTTLIANLAGISDTDSENIILERNAS